MSWPLRPDLLHAFLAVVALALTAALFVLRSRKGAFEQKAAALEAELARLRSAPAYWEYRVERFDAVWFPTVAASVSENRVVSASPGVPHCGQCVLPLSTSGGLSQWKCAACAKSYPESLVDVTVTDAVVRLALERFRESHRGFRGP